MQTNDKKWNMRPDAGPRSKTWGLQWALTAGVMMFVPSLLGAKGCELGNLGSDEKACGGLTGLECKTDEFCNFSPEAMCGAADATGTCEVMPEVCADVYDPVCGCDDETYANECEAHASGVSVVKFEACDSEPSGTTCGGIQGLGCAAGEYCNTAAFACAPDATGECEAKPEVCTDDYRPVCGCDGKTYGNACVAASAGVTVAATGECASNGPTACDAIYQPVCGEDGKTYGNACEATAANVEVAFEGECRPTVCPAIYAPVCGKDGKTYGNSCEAAAAEVEVVHEGECESTGNACGGIAGLACSDGEFCAYAPDACGAADQTGVCTAIPEACDAILAPVCGCDGKTYSSDCDANLHGVSVRSKGECEDASGGDCGGLTGMACADDEFCDYPIKANCGAADQTGTCAAIPEACTKEFNPVCGCDDQTYANECMAHAAGVSVASTGECDGANSGDVCGGLLGVACADGEFCNFPVETQCGSGDQTGTCEVCTAVYTPVCGCDGKSYGNACAAHGAGVSVAADGECDGSDPGEQACGGPLDNICPDGTFCEVPVDAQCSADVIGVCTEMTEVCTEEYNPVCGCDGKTHSNACFARGAATSIAYEGECD